MKRTPAIEASLIYGIALVLAFVFFLVTANLQLAISYSQGLAVLVLFPSWALWVGVTYVFKRAGKFGRFAGNVSVMSVVAIAAILTINALAASAPAAEGKKVVATFVYILTCYFFTSLFAAAITQFWIFRKPDRIKTGELPQTTKPRAKKK